MHWEPFGEGFRICLDDHGANYIVLKSSLFETFYNLRNLADCFVGDLNK